MRSNLLVWLMWLRWSVGCRCLCCCRSTNPFCHRRLVLRWTPILPIRDTHVVLWRFLATYLPSYSSISSCFVYGLFWVAYRVFLHLRLGSACCPVYRRSFRVQHDLWTGPNTCSCLSEILVVWPSETEILVVWQYGSWLSQWVRGTHLNCHHCGIDCPDDPTPVVSHRSFSTASSHSTCPSFHRTSWFWWTTC